MIKPLEGDRWGKQETTEQGSNRQLKWEKGKKVTGKENEETGGEMKWKKKKKMRSWGWGERKDLHRESERQGKSGRWAGRSARALLVLVMCFPLIDPLIINIWMQKDFSASDHCAHVKEQQTKASLKCPSDARISLWYWTCCFVWKDCADCEFFLFLFFLFFKEKVNLWKSTTFNY